MLGPQGFMHKRGAVGSSARAYPVLHVQEVCDYGRIRVADVQRDNARAVEAASAAGLEFTLLEEPQAAFYSWLADHDTDWRDYASEGDVILVCDIGGGTTDFSLISVKDSGGDLELQRMAVGNHTLLQ